jgi:2-aminoethylphosphonate-pyruvate transaminase
MRIDAALSADPSITHVAQVHCETGTGILNPLPQIAAVVAKHGRGLIIDAMSSYGAIPIDARTVRFDALIAASGKCLEGVPGMGFIIARRSTLERAAGNSCSLAMDLLDQWQYMQKTGQWRFTPPTHVLAACAPRSTNTNSRAGRVRAAGALYRELRRIGFRHARAGLQNVFAGRPAGADHRYLPFSRRSSMTSVSFYRRCATADSSIPES